MKNRLIEIIDAAGGANEFVKRMDALGGNARDLRAIASGKRRAGQHVRQAIIDACDGAISHDEIIAIGCGNPTGANVLGKVDENWAADDDSRRNWVTTRAADAARKQRLANERADRAA